MSRRKIILPPVEEIDRILYDVEDPRDAALLWLFRNGLKTSEAINLRCSDLFVDGRTIIARVKGFEGKIRDVPLFPPTAMAVWLTVKNDWWPKEHDRYVITTQQRPQMSRKTSYNICKKHTGEHPMMLRHIYATHLINSGVSLPLVMDLLGHNSIVTTMQYYHTTRDQLVEATKSAYPGLRK